jgi:predicted glutamine amidotransferase
VAELISLIKSRKRDCPYPQATPGLGGTGKLPTLCASFGALLHLPTTATSKTLRRVCIGNPDRWATPDSERAFCWVMVSWPSPHAWCAQRGRADDHLRELAAHTSHPTAPSTLLSNGRHCAQASTRQTPRLVLHPAPSSICPCHAAGRRCQHQLRHTSCDRQGGGGATTPLTTNEVWTPLTLGELVVFEGGERTATEG